jgi:hypothetical protein
VFFSGLDDERVLELILIVELVKFVNVEEVDYAALVILMKLFNALSAEVSLMVGAVEVFLFFLVVAAVRHKRDTRVGI